MTLAQRSAQGFTNESCALGITSDVSVWTKITLDRGARSIVLCTDGVADDLLPNRFGDFLDWLVTEAKPEPPQKRRRMLERALREWPTPNHLDDKTVAVVHIAGGGA